MKSIIWGIVLVTLGVLLGGRAAGLFDFDIFFDGWWTLFIIIPCFVGLLTEKGARVGNMIGLGVGVLLLLACQDVIAFDMFWKLLVPGIIIIIGLALIFKNLFAKQFNDKVKEIKKDLKDGAEGEEIAAFSGQNVNMDGEEFKGKKISAVFGGFKLDLRGAKIDKEAVVEASAVFGGIEIFVPEKSVVKIKSNSAFGGIKKTHKDSDDKDAPVIYINGSAVFGGIEVK